MLDFEVGIIVMGFGENVGDIVWVGDRGVVIVGFFFREFLSFDNITLVLVFYFLIKNVS